MKQILRTRSTATQLLFLSVIIFLALGTGMPAPAAERILTEEQSPLYFSIDIPQVIIDWGKGDKRRIHRFTLESKAKTASDTVAKIVLLASEPSYHFRFSRNPRFLVRKFSYLSEATFSPKDLRRIWVHGGSQLYLPVIAHERACLVFTQRLVSNPAGALPQGSRLTIAGYYCQPTGAVLDDAAAAVVIGAVGVKSKGSLAPTKVPAPSHSTR